MSLVKSVLTIAGSDSSGGAGIQADIKTIQALGLFATSAITAITAQNTMGVRSIQEISPSIIRDQIRAVFEDIRPDAVKIGMVSTSAIVEVIADELTAFNAQHIVVDPVMVATSGSSLIRTDAIEALETLLFPLAEVITPNLAEAQALSDFSITSPEEVEEAAQSIARSVAHGNPAILVKGGHAYDSHAEKGESTSLHAAQCDAANDYLHLPDGSGTWLMGKRIDNPNTHGTGCTLSSAIACGLAKGSTIENACHDAKHFIEGALNAQLNLGSGSGPLQHNWRQQ